MRCLRSFIAILALCCSVFFCHSTHAETPASLSPTNLDSLPSRTPVPVETSLYIWNLYDVDERNGTFSTDFYLVLKWQDARLAVPGLQDPYFFVDDAAKEKLKQIWWPQLDFVNASSLVINNLVLTIDEKGEVVYSAKIKGTFFVNMNFKQFPFDQQSFEIRLQSFYWTADEVEFTANPNTGFLKKSEIEGLRIQKITTSVSQEKYPFIDEIYSQYTAAIHLERNPSFFLYQTLIPLVIILGMTGCMFYLKIEELSSRIYIGQSTILVLVAMKFVINQTLPEIDYLTLVDYIFFVSYFCAGITIVLSVIDWKLSQKNNPISATLNKRAVWIPLALFFVMYIFLLYITKVL